MLVVSDYGEKTQDIWSSTSSRLQDDSLSLPKKKKNLSIQHNLNLLDYHLIKMMCDYKNPADFLTDEFVDNLIKWLQSLTELLVMISRTKRGTRGGNNAISPNVNHRGRFVSIHH